MIALTDLFPTGTKVPKSIVNAHSSGGASCQTGNLANLPAKKTLSGALTAGTWKTVLSVNADGFIDFLMLNNENGSGKTISLRLTLDGTVVFSATSNSLSGGGYALMCVGAYFYQSGYVPIAFQRVNFSSSLLVEVMSSVTETDNLAIYTNYGTY